VNKTIKSILAIVLLLFPVGSAIAGQAQPQMFLQTESTRALAETVKIFKEEIAAGGWSILNMTNMAGVLSEKGYTISPVLIFDVCSGKYSAQILARDEQRFVTPLMPCRVSIYQTSQGKVIIARLNAGSMAPMFSAELADIMTKSGKEIEEVIEKTMARLKKAR